MEASNNDLKNAEYTAAELADHVDGRIIGNRDIRINSARGIDEAEEKSITFADNDKFFQKALKSKAALIIVPDNFESETEKTLLLTDNPRTAYAKIASLFFDTPYKSGKISEKAVIAETAQIGKDVSIHPGVIIGENTVIGDGTIIAPGSVIADDVKIGKNCLLHPAVVVERGSRIGDSVTIQASTVIGSDGYGYASDSEGHHKVPQLGNVVIESEVEIGANVAIDRGTSGSTVIGKGTKIDNLVQIAHNVKVGPECLIIAQVGIAGSTTVEKRVTLAGQAGVVGHINLAEKTTAAARSMVTSDTKKGDFISGAPAQNHRRELKEKASLRRLPDLQKRVKELEKRLFDLEKNN
ncbi:MAG: UDP-3-O-(3-hydroxymyristoyl)glucosamine N-acyltransferase [Bacillota bacterium]